MGIFDSKQTKAEMAARTQAAEDEVMQKLAQCPLLDNLITTVVQSEKEDNPWILECQGYYDSRVRHVEIGYDSFVIKWVTTHKEEYQYQAPDGSIRTDYKTVEDIHGKVGYSYTKSGYVPLHEYTSSKIKDVKTGSPITVCGADVVSLWSKVVKERMSAAMKECRFDPSSTGWEFTYKVPALHWNDWF